jgi:RimJ/RimL family protein N-acetyltransferase
MTTLIGNRIRLTADVETDPPVIAGWWRDSEYGRLQDDEPAYPKPVDHISEWFADEIDKESIGFQIRARDGDRLIGFVGLFVDWPNQDAWLGIGIGDRADWGQGYGTEALKLALAYAFDELNLARVSLSVLGNNPRAIRAYEKAGFVLEGRSRGHNLYDGQRLDEAFMGILRLDWERQP